MNKVVRIYVVFSYFFLKSISWELFEFILFAWEYFHIVCVLLFCDTYVIWVFYFYERTLWLIFICYYVLCENLHLPIKIVIIKLEYFNNKNSKQYYYINKNNNKCNKCVDIFLKYKIDWLFLFMHKNKIFFLQIYYGYSLLYWRKCR